MRFLFAEEQSRMCLQGRYVSRGIDLVRIELTGQGLQVSE